MAQEARQQPVESYRFAVGRDARQRIFYDTPHLAMQSGILTDEILQMYCMMRHWHPELELCYVRTGAVRYTVNDAQYLLEAGSGILVAPDQLHESETLGPCSYCVLVVHPESWCGDPVLRAEYMERIRTDCLVLRDTVDWQAEIGRCVQEIVRENETRSDCYELRIKSLLYRILAELGSHSSAAAPHRRDDPQLDAVKAILTFLHAHYTEKLTLCQLAQAGAVSKSGCARLFQRYLQRTPMQYLTRFRLRQSLPLLCAGRPVTDVALACGFRSASYYAEQFRAVYGCAPRQFRAMHASPAAELGKSTE